jgi:outer membrane lipoprotein SlyB
MMKSSLKHAAVALTAAMLLSGCSRNISSSNYSSGSVGEAMTTYQGSIINVRKVKMQEGDKLTDNVAGMVVGGLLGGVAGNMVGKGHGNTAATVGGALLGAGAGAAAQKALSEQDGLEYSVKLTNGNIMTVVQGEDNPMSVGQRVLVQVSHGKEGRSSVVPDSSPTQDVQPMQQTQTIVVNRK